MLEIPFWVFVIKVQTIIVFFVLFIVYFILARRYKKQLLQRSSGPDTVATPQARNTLPDPQIKELGTLRERLAIAQQRVENLERFRELFFEMKEKLAALLAQQEAMDVRMQAAGLPPEQQQELMAEFEKLKKEKETLEQHLQQVEAELNLLMESSQPQQNGQKEQASATNIIQEQQAEIGRLIQEIADLEVEAAQAQRIQSSINSLNNHSDELAIAIEVLQDENQFLSDQIQSLLKQEQENDRQTASQIDLMTSQLSQLQHDYDELNAKHTRLESEYLKSRT